MRTRRHALKIIVLLGSVAVVTAVTALVVPSMARKSEPAPAPLAVGPKLADDAPDALDLSSEVVRAMEVKTTVASVAPAPTPLRLDGRLWPDTNRLTRVHTRFPGEVVEIGAIETLSDDPHDETPHHCVRPLRLGDNVTKGQLLAVVWSTDLGEKKSELVVALSRLTLHQETAARLKELDLHGAGTERSLREAEQVVEADEIAVENAKQTLRTWRLSESDIEHLVEEAARLHKHRGDTAKDVKEGWARVEVRAPQDGVIVEKNVTAGEFIDTQLDMFKIADLTRLEVAANAYEEDLRLIEDRPPEARSWKIYLKSNSQAPPLVGRFNQISVSLDLAQHTAIVRGWVDNSEGRLRIGQFIAAEIELAPPEHAVAVPTTAVIDRNGEYRVFVQRDPQRERYTSVPVDLVHRFGEELIYVTTLSSVRGARTSPTALQPGDRVVTSGGLEISVELEQLQAAARTSRGIGL